MFRNDDAHWGWPAKTLHWLGAILIVMLLAHGWWMTHLAPRADRLAHYVWHASIGYDFLALLVLRLLWRWMNPVPALPQDSLPWERAAARTGHIALYGLMFASALTGWALAGTFPVPMNEALFGLVRVPAVTSGGDRVMHDLYEKSHEILSYLLAALVVVHIAGALRHHFIKRNDVLRRIWMD